MNDKMNKKEWLKRLSITSNQIAERAGISENTARSWINDYKSISQKMDDKIFEVVVEMAHEIADKREMLRNKYINK